MNSTTANELVQQPRPQPQQPQPQETRLVDIPVTDENSALNLMANFLTLAHKRGTYSIEESAKIWECLKVFQK